MKRRNVYTVSYLFSEMGTEHHIDVIAGSKWEAYDKATYEAIPEKEGSLAYATWVDSVTYQNGNVKRFNTFAGKPV